MNKSKVLNISRTAILLALAIVSQFLKNLSVYITGPIINTIIIIATLYAGLYSGLLISFITPITSYLITGSPVMTALPLIIPMVAIGNAIMSLSVYFITKKKRSSLRLISGLVCGTSMKALFMYFIIVLLIIGLMGPNTSLPQKALDLAKTTFSVTQLITASIGSVISFTIYKALDLYMNRFKKGEPTCEE